MTARRSVLLQFLALAVAVAMSMVAWPFLGFGLPLLSGPVVVAGLLGASVAVIRGRNVPPVGIFAALAVASMLFLGQHAFLLGAIARGFFSVRLLLAMVFGLFLGLAPIMARVEPNPWFGVRTPWTLGSRRVWKATHRATGRLWIVGGVLGSALTMFGAPFPIVLVYLVVLGFAPAAISYRIWRQMGRP